MSIENGTEAPAISFSTLLISIASAALSGLGVIPNPTTGKMEKNVLLARHNIDLLTLLKEKTSGNLSEEEASLMDNLLYDLQLKFVADTQPAKAAEGATEPNV